MILLQRTIPFLFTLFSLLLWELSFLFKEWYLFFFSSLLVLVTIAVAQLLRWRLFSQQFLGLWVAPFFFTLAAILFLLFVENFWIQQLIVFLHIIACGLFLESCFAYLHNAKGYQPYALQNTASLINLAGTLLFYSAIFGFSLYFRTPVWVLLLAVIFASYLSIVQTFWIHKISIRTNKLFIGIIVFLLAQLFWAIQYLPVSWLVSGMTLGAFYYLTVHLSKYHLLKSFNRAVVFRYLLVALFVLASVLGTAQWI